MSDTITVRVRSVTWLAPRVLAYELVPPEPGAALPAFSAGAHVAVRLPSGLERQYSLFNDPRETHRYCIAVQREDAGRGGSVEMHEALRPGDPLTISAPRNLFPLAPGASHSLLIAGGIGLTPILAMARQLAREGKSFSLLHLARDRQSAPFSDELAALAEAGHDVTLHLDGGKPENAYDIAGLLAAPSPNTHVYCCGPEGLMAAVRAASAHWPPEAVHFEHFANAEAGVQKGDAPITVHLAKTGTTLTVPSDRSILATLLEAGLDIDYSCEEGTCGTCITRLLAGEADHRDKVLTPGEREGNIIICCSRAKTPSLTLDL